MTTLLITGMSGLLGANLALLARERYRTVGSFYQHPIVVPGVTHAWSDLLQPGAATQLVDETQPDIIIHAAGLTSVDACQRDAELARRLNVDVAWEIARLAGAMGLKLAHLSSDHVFAGVSAWHTEDEIPVPVNVYAATKAEAEQRVLQSCPDALIIRTNFYGWGTPVRQSFSDWILGGLRQGRELRMFRDVYFTPLLINDLADIIFDLIERDAAGVYHAAGSDRLSKLEFAYILAEEFAIDHPQIVPVALEASGLGAPRPRDMSLATDKVSRLLGRRMSGVRAGLRHLRELEAKGWPAVVAGVVQARAPGRR